MTNGDEDLSPEAKFRGMLPESMKAEVLVRARVEDPEVQKSRAETVKAKSVYELSQINSLADLPIPTTFENLMNRNGPAPVERKKRFREK